MNWRKLQNLLLKYNKDWIKGKCPLCNETILSAVFTQHMQQEHPQATKNFKQAVKRSTIVTKRSKLEELIEKAIKNYKIDVREWNVETEKTRKFKLSLFYILGAEESKKLVKFLANKILENGGDLDGK